MELNDSTTQQEPEKKPTQQQQPQPHQSTLASTCADNSPSKNSDKDRILRRGDLVRILGRKDKKLKDHHRGDLGRVIRSIPITECDRRFDDDEEDDDEDDHHPYVYDIELVLGGKLMAVNRSEFYYTTAFEEGMTGESRQKRKRKSNEEKLENLNTKTKSSKTMKKATETKSVASQKGKRRSSTNNTGNSRGNSKKLKGRSSTESTMTPILTTNGLNIFDRHRREFERSLARIEKADVYHLFTGQNMQSSFDECHSLAKSSDAQQALCEATTLSSSSVDLPTKLSCPDTAASQTNNDGTSTSSIVTTDSTEQKSDSPPYNLTVVRKRLEHGRYYLDREQYETEQRITLMTPYYRAIGRSVPSTKNKLPNFHVQHKKVVDWDLFRNDIFEMCDAAILKNSNNSIQGGHGCATGSSTLKYTATKIKDLTQQMYDKIAYKHALEIEIANDRHRFTAAIDATQNTEAAMQGKRWRREAFPERRYEKLRNDVVCAGLSELDERVAAYELKTSLKNSFVGLAYSYDDTGQSEGWMKAMLDEADCSSKQQNAALALASDEGVIRAQVAASIESLLMAVQDRVMTETEVLEQAELRSANWESNDSTKSAESAGEAEIVEQPVWGVDCYTRRNVSICLETEFDSDTVHTFIEKWLLPAINACPVDLAYNLCNAALVLEGQPLDASSSLVQDGTTTEQWSATILGRALIRKIKESSPLWLRSAAHILRRSIRALGQDFFRVHPKGHGSIVLCPKIAPNRLVTFYRGEVYPSWRWGEKMDAIAAIQQKKGLKPRLPDFYNMALERPQTDPRGYGLLFVDASRKSGYGSMLSHSCNPSCEVKVVALNGELTLAMTTLREMTIGEEVTFDYNAATDSLHEYQAAVCLCGNVQCRGSFLHFATADCYQQVLNRNSPIAVMLSQLVKGCTKQVMAEDDIKILERHGFLSAAFGAISVNRRKVTSAPCNDSNLDSMELVPIWLRTFVADILRYIEYERQALPISLICNDITKENDAEKTKSSHREATKKTCDSKKEASSSKKSREKCADSRPIKGNKPEPSFLFFLRRRREHFVSKLLECDVKRSSTGLVLEAELKKLASAEWKTFSRDTKHYWKQQAIDEWKKDGGEDKARLETERLQRPEKEKQVPPSNDINNPEHDSKEGITRSDVNHVGEENPRSISFQAADAEGIRAMEQRIQQLTQSLSRVGRVLDRHREECLRKQERLTKVDSAADLRALAHSPLSIMPDEHVVAWMWNHKDGIIPVLLKHAKAEICVSPQLMAALEVTKSKYAVLSEFGTPWISRVASSNCPMQPSEGRKLLNEALLEFRMNLLEGIDNMAAEIKSLKASAREDAKRKLQQAIKLSNITSSTDRLGIRAAVSFVLNEMVCSIEQKFALSLSDSPTQKPSVVSDITDPWLLNYNKRFKLEKAADLLLLYSRTSTFFRVQPYETLKSSSIEVYARELGNAVPLSVVDHGTETVTPGKAFSTVQDGCNLDDSAIINKESYTIGSAMEIDDDSVEKSMTHKPSGMCDPEDIVSEVVVGYQGDYVLSQLLQWYNAGLEQKPGLPDMLGCCFLPSMAGCWKIDTTKISNSSTDKRTSYRERTRPRLVDWFKDPYKRGSAWPEELRRQFVDKEDDLPITIESQAWLPIGSPILDFLVTGDDFNMMDILSQLGSDSSALEEESSARLMSTIDRGRPALAVSNWVQCENPNCQKWRKIPWHVDIDMLSEKFVCSDNIWNQNSAYCDAPEDEWDEENDACVEADGSVKPREVDIVPVSQIDAAKKPTTTELCKLAGFQIGARFDVLRESKKEKWSVANVVDVDFVGLIKKVKFHFPHTQLRHDLWLDADSNRIAPLHTRTGQQELQKSNKSEGVSNSKLDKWKEVKKAIKPRTYRDDESLDPSLAVLSEYGSEGIDNEDDFEEVGVGAVKSYQDIGCADSDDESKAEEVELVDTESCEDEDDGLDDAIEDDDDDESDENSDDAVLEEIIAATRGVEAPTVTDHSSPDGSPKRDLQHPSESVGSSSVSQQFIIPKKRQSCHPNEETMIPRKKPPILSGQCTGDNVGATRQSNPDSKSLLGAHSPMKKSRNHQGAKSPKSSPNLRNHSLPKPAERSLFRSPSNGVASKSEFLYQRESSRQQSVERRRELSSNHDCIKERYMYHYADHGHVKNTEAEYGDDYSRRGMSESSDAGSPEWKSTFGHGTNQDPGLSTRYAERCRDHHRLDPVYLFNHDEYSSHSQRRYPEYDRSWDRRWIDTDACTSPSGRIEPYDYHREAMLHGRSRDEYCIDLDYASDYSPSRWRQPQIERSWSRDSSWRKPYSKERVGRFEECKFLGHSERSYEPKGKRSPNKNRHQMVGMKNPNNRRYDGRSPACNQFQEGHLQHDEYPIPWSEEEHGDVSPAKRNKHYGRPHAEEDRLPDDFAIPFANCEEPNSSCHEDKYRYHRHKTRWKDEYYDRWDHDDGHESARHRDDYRRLSSPRSSKSRKKDHSGRDEYTRRKEEYSRKAADNYDTRYRR